MLRTADDMKLGRVFPTKKKSISLCSTEVTSSVTEHEDFSTLYDLKHFFQLEDYDDDLSEIIRSPSSVASQSERDERQDRPNTSGTPYVSSVDRNELQQINLLGSGQFCNVYSVTGSLLQPWECEGNSPRKRSMFAFKTIDSSRIGNPDDLVVAATDLANEAKILSQLDHKNVIRLRGISNERFSQSFNTDGESGGEGFFLVLDILKETLSDRLHHWRKNGSDRKHAKNQFPSPLSSLGLRSSSAGSKGMPSPLSSLGLRSASVGSKGKGRSHPMSLEDCQRNFMYNRIENIAFGIAEAMEYLHSKQIVLRDLKPSNIGFDFETGTQVRLFDFGMARRITDCPRDEICGSPRYMAPEVMFGRGYSLKVDAYSFGVLLFEISSLCVPYEDNYWSKKKHVYNRKSMPKSKLKSLATKNKSNGNKQVKKVIDALEDFYLQVGENQLRPTDDLNSTVPCGMIRALIHDCWNTDPSNRPPFSEILSRLEKIFKRQQDPKDLN